MSHIHLLAKNAFKNNAPHHLVNNSMYKMTADGNFRFVGSDFNARTAASVQTYSKLFRRNFEKATKSNQFQDEESGNLEIELFLSHNSDAKKHNLKKFRQMARDLKRGQKPD